MSGEEILNSDGVTKSGGQQLIKKLTTEKALKVHKRQAAADGQGRSGLVSGAIDDIVNINLSGRGIITIESLQLPALRRLDLSKNKLNRLKGLQGCPQVTYLTAAGNELTGEGLDGVRPLRDLKVLNASWNRIKRVPPAALSQFRELQALVLNNNEIVEIAPSLWKKGVRALNTLVLSHNKIKSLTSSGLGNLTALTKLSISHNTLLELPDLSTCPALGELRAAHNQLSVVPTTLAKNVALRTLDLGHNAIEDWGNLEVLGGALSSLVQLTLAGNPLQRQAASEERDAGDSEDEAEDGAYLLRIRSIFPGLKVRDGKRILLKKRHAYHEERTGSTGVSRGKRHRAGGDDGGADEEGENGGGGRKAGKSDEGRVVSRNKSKKQADGAVTKGERGMPGPKQKKKPRHVEESPAAFPGSGKDPYSSAEELPTPVSRKEAGAGADSVVSEGRNPVSRGGDAESGVVAVVHASKKKKGRDKASTRRKGEQKGGAKSEGGAGVDRGGFSVKSMLQARQEREMIGLGLGGASAWD